MRKAIIGLMLTLAALLSAQENPSVDFHSNNVLVLIQPALAGPNVNPLNYWQPAWVLWPPALREADGSGLLSVSTGQNWVGDPADFNFDASPTGKGWISRNFQKMRSRGYFSVRNSQFGSLRTDLLVGNSGSASPAALRLALNGDSAAVVPYRLIDKVWPANSLMVTEAPGWDAVADIERYTKGRVLVVEYPPREGEPLTRFWYRGWAWPFQAPGLDLAQYQAIVPRQPELPIPGLIRARLLIQLVTHPEKFLAEEVTFANWPGAYRFWYMCHTWGFLVSAAWMLSVVGVVIWAAVLVSNEQTSHVSPILLTGALLSPASISFAGQVGRVFGVDAWPIWIGICSFILVMLASGLMAWQRRVLPRAHPLLSVFWVGLLTLCLTNPIWSFLSPVFTGRTGTISYIALGALFGYLAGLITCLRGCGSIWIWIGRSAALSLLACGPLLNLWYADDLGATLFIPIAAVVIGEGRFRWPMLALFGFWPSSLVPIFLGGVIWAPLGLLVRGRDTVGLNLATYVDFLTCPGLLVFVAISGAIAIFGYRFFFHQLRQLGKLDPRRNSFTIAAIVAGSFGLLHPTFLISSLVLASGAIVALLFDAVQTM